MPRKTRGGDGSISRRAALLLIGGGGLMAVSGTGSFSQVEGSRRFGVGTTNDQDALLGISSIPNPLELQSQSTVKLFELTNQLPNSKLTVSVSADKSWFSVTSPNNDTLDSDEDTPVRGRLTNSGGSVGGTVEFTITATSKGSDQGRAKIEATRSTQINANSSPLKKIIGLVSKHELEFYKSNRDGTITQILSESAKDLEAIGTIGSDIYANNNPHIVGIEKVKGESKIVFIDRNGRDKANISLPTQPRTQKTTLSTGSFNANHTEYNAFYTTQNGAIYGISRNGTSWGSPEEVIQPSNGASAVLPPADIDDDGNKELPFADGSQQIRYYDLEEPAPVKIENSGVGSSSGIGIGPVATIDGRTVMPIVDGSQNLTFLGPQTDENGTSVTDIATFEISGSKPAKSRVTVADIDGDNKLEVVYLTNSKKKLKYIGDISLNDPEDYTIGTISYGKNEIKQVDKKKGVV